MSGTGLGRNSAPDASVEEQLPEMNNHVALATFVRNHLDLFDHLELNIDPTQ